MTNILVWLLISGIAITLFLIFRELIRLFRKINYVIKLMEIQNELLNEQNNLMEKIFALFGGRISDNERIKSTISNSDLEIIDQLKKNIKSDELILKVRHNGRIEKWKKADWAQIVKLGHHGRFDLLFMN